MPIMDGKEAAGVIRDLNEEVPIVAITANPMNVEESSEERLFDDFASKPLRREVLLRVMKHWIIR
jgi:CheY-like chemotaxis protein